MDAEHLDAGIQGLPGAAGEGLREGDHGQNLEIRRSSASRLGKPVRDPRASPTVSKYIDTTTCIGCKACEVACQRMERPADGRAPSRPARYQTLPTLHAEYWNLIRFNEQDARRRHRVAHAQGPVHALRGAGCLGGLPGAGRASCQYANGIVDVNPDQCIGCGYCETGCPSTSALPQTTGKMAKCTLCVDRVEVGLGAGLHQGVPDRVPPVRDQGRHGRAGTSSAWTS